MNAKWAQSKHSKYRWSPSMLTITSLFILLFYAVKGDDECVLQRSSDFSYEHKLLTDLMCDYDPENRPVSNHSAAINVTVQLVVKYLNFDSQEETINVNSWMILVWRDEFLNWKPSDYGGISELTVESTRIWTPQISLYNANLMSMFSFENFYTTCIVNFSGIVMCVPQVSHSAICSSKLRNWPFDEQNCTLRLGAWMHSGEQINFKVVAKNSQILAGDFQIASGWRLTNVSEQRHDGKYKCCPNETYPALKYTFIIQREASGPVALVVVPSIVIICLTMSTLLLDVKDNLRVYLVCFSIFSHFIFLSEIGNIIPKHSADTPVILLFLRDSLVLTLASLLVTLIMMHLRRRVRQPHYWISKLNRAFEAGAGRYVVFIEFDPNVTTDKSAILDSEPRNDFLIEEEKRNAKEWTGFCNILNNVTMILISATYLILIIFYIPH